MIAIVDYGMGNLRSVERNLSQLSKNSVVTSDAKTIEKADAIILPGVGHFGRAMEALKQRDLIHALNTSVLEKKTPILGICLGMQLMTQGSEEGGTEGLNWFSCKTERLIVEHPYSLKIPHVGWNTIDFTTEQTMLTHIPTGSEVYFVHSFGVLEATKDEVLTTTNYGNIFISSLKKGHLVGMQFHPEKSHDIGLQLFQNFIDSISPCTDRA
jgi:glutamine amidotransferase